MMLSTDDMQIDNLTFQPGDNMTPHPSRRAAIFMATAALFAAPFVLQAQEQYPAKPISWIVAYPPGGGSDFLARTVATRLGRQLGLLALL